MTFLKCKNNTLTPLYSTHDPHDIHRAIHMTTDSQYPHDPIVWGPTTFGSEHPDVLS